MAIYSEQELSELGLGRFGTNVRLSKMASLYRPENIYLGNNVRIDDFCVLSAGDGGIYIGDYIHVAVYTSLIGKGRITLKDFCNLSSKVAIYSSNDDYSGDRMTNPMVPEEYTGVTHADVMIGKHAIIGCGSIILPGVILEDGVTIGALSLVNKSCDAFGIYVGVPAKKVKDRKRNLLLLEEELLKNKCI